MRAEITESASEMARSLDGEEAAIISFEFSISRELRAKAKGIELEVKGEEKWTRAREADGDRPHFIARSRGGKDLGLKFSIRSRAPDRTVVIN